MVLLVIVPGILIVAVTTAWLARRRRSTVAAASDLRAGTDVINAASIKVAGVGGLGLVAMAVTVALNVPRIGYTLGIGLVLGIVAAAILIVRARRTGPLPSSGKGVGATAVLQLREPAGPVDAVRPGDDHLDREAILAAAH